MVSNCEPAFPLGELSVGGEIYWDLEPPRMFNEVDGQGVATPWR